MLPIEYHTYRALVVDDDPGVRQSVGSVLEATGLQALLAGSGPEAVESVRLQTVHFSIIDVHVHELDGLEILSRLRKIIHGLPAILMSGNLTAEIEARARAAGARTCLRKPLEVDRLRQAVRGLIERDLLGRRP
jgi:ATP-dependent Lon protease